MSSVARLPLSCFIIAKDESDRIVRSIGAVRDFVDEVVVVDSGSVDRTQELAREAGARVVFNPWRGFGQQKRFAEEQCRNDWLLNIDADEVIPEQLAREIMKLFADGLPKHAAYGVPINFVYPGCRRPRLWARDHHCLRLYDRRRVRFKDSRLHDSVDPAGHPVGKLKHEIYHFSFRSMLDLIRKCDERASYNARWSKPKSKWVLQTRCITEFPINFFKYYLGRRHFTGGLMGLKCASIISYYRLARVWRLIQIQHGDGLPVVGTSQPSTEAKQPVDRA